MTDVAAEMVDPATLKAWPQNPRKNDGEPVEKVADSIKRFGFAAPIVARRETREIIAGHTRWKAAQKLKLTAVPVRFLDLSEREAHLLALADNRLGELAEWDTPELHALLASYDLGDQMIAGWSEKDLRELERAARGDAENPDDDAPEPPADPVTRPGDLWLLGKHRLVCGDATDGMAVGLAKAKLEPFMMVTDPPSDDRASWLDAWKLHAGPVAYVWSGGLHNHVVAGDLETAGFKLRAQIVWRKPVSVGSRGHYKRQHESCWYAVREGTSTRWGGDRTQSTIWDLARRDGSEESLLSTQKPIECMARPIRNHGTVGDVVYDPFCGSGTTLIAAEHLGRVCVALELSPAYCDSIVERWQRLTGEPAQRQG
jgi:ParB-like chromosome segregation protein Spo0J